jgi:hypothetical protein
MTDSRDDSGKKVIRAKFEVTKGSGHQIEKSASGDFIGIWREKPYTKMAGSKGFKLKPLRAPFSRGAMPPAKSSTDGAVSH